MKRMADDNGQIPQREEHAIQALAPSIWKITAVAVLGSLLTQLDATIVNVSLSSLTKDLGSTLPAIQWVTSAYLLALTLVLPLNGWLVERIGGKALYFWCFPLFTASSALCGFAWSANSHSCCSGSNVSLSARASSR